MSFDWDPSKYASTSDLQAGPGYILIDVLNFQPAETVLDIGCGIGNLTFEMSSRCRQGFVLGIDASKSMINKARTNPKGVTKIAFRVCDAERIKYRHEFDVVFSNSALHWVLDSEKVLAAIRCALKPGGRIGLQYPLLNGRHPLIVCARKTVASLDYDCFYAAWKFPWFVTTAKDYAALLEHAGFRNVEVKEIQTAYRFKTAPKACCFLDTVGIGLYLTPLNAEQAQRFKDRLLEDLERAVTSEGVLFHFDRLFAFGSVSR